MSTVVLITGAWHVAKHYTGLCAALEAKGHQVICKTLPSNNDAVPPNTVIGDDIAFVQGIFKTLTEQGKRITVLCHSWGGMVASGSCLPYKATSASSGGITNIVYMAAFVPNEDQCLAELTGGDSLPPHLVPKDDGTLDWTDGIKYLYNGVDEAEAIKAEKLRVHHGLKIQITPIDAERVAWRDIPMSYIVCEEDRALVPAAQEAMIKKVRDSGVHVKEYRLKTGHSPFLSMLPETVDCVVDAINGHP